MNQQKQFAKTLGYVIGYVNKQLPTNTPSKRRLRSIAAHYYDCFRKQKDIMRLKETQKYWFGFV